MLPPEEIAELAKTSGASVACIPIFSENMTALEINIVSLPGEKLSYYDIAGALLAFQSKILDDKAHNLAPVEWLAETKPSPAPRTSRYLGEESGTKA